MHILRKNIAFIAGLALVFISWGLLLLVKYNRSETYEQETGAFFKDFSRDGFVPFIKNQTSDLTRYTIKINLVSGLEKGVPEDFAIQFCDKYSLSLAKGKVFMTSLADVPGGEVITTALEGIRVDAPLSFKSGHLTLLLECNLTSRTVGIYINGVFIQKVSLGSETLHYAVNLKGAYVYITKFKIADDKGRLLFNGNILDLIVPGKIGELFFFIGWLFLCLLIFYEISYWRRALFIILVLLVLEGFLRNVKAMDPDYNINVVAYKWDLKTQTNLFGPLPPNTLSNNRSTVWFSGEKAKDKKPEGCKRIIIIGSSPVGGAILLDPVRRSFPALLRKKLNPGDGNKVSVIATAFARTSMLSLQCNIYLTDVLFKLKPDLVVFYSGWDGEEKGIREEQILYARARKIMDGNSDWVVSNRLLYAALEFENPVKELVCLYNSLCESYVFMRLENARKRIFNEWSYLFPKRSAKTERPTMMAEACFERMVRMCRENNIKLVLMPGVYFYLPKIGLQAEESIREIAHDHPEVHILGLQKLFLEEHKDHKSSYDAMHPNERGHRILAEEIFRKIMQDDLLGVKLKEKSYGANGR